MDTALGIVRHVLTAGAGALATDGVISNSQATIGVAIVMWAIGAAWSAWNKYQHRQALAKGA